jgi:hypothetical protein
MHIHPDVALVGEQGLAGVHSHPDAHWTGRRELLGRPGRSDRVGRPGEGDKERITLRVHLDAVVTREAVAQDATVPGQNLRVALAELVEKAMSSQARCVAKTPAARAPRSGSRRVCATSELFDLALGRVEPLLAEAVELLAPLPELERLVERRFTGLEAMDDLLELGLRLLERHRVFSTRAPKPPSASSTSTRSPVSSPCAERTMASSARTIA